MHDAITSELVELRGQRRGREMPVGGIFQKKFHEVNKHFCSLAPRKSICPSRNVVKIVECCICFLCDKEFVTSLIVGTRR